MAKKNWYVYSQGATFGPLDTQVILLMVKQKRLSNVEFVWCEGMTCWQRMRDMPEFGAKGLPPYPNVPIPPEQPPVEEAAEAETEAVAEEPTAEEASAEEPVVEETATEEVSAEEAPAEEAAAEPVAEETIAEEPEPAPPPPPPKPAKPALKVIAGAKGTAKAPAAKPAPKATALKPAPAAAAAAVNAPGALKAKMMAKKAAGATAAKPFVTIRKFERVAVQGSVTINGKMETKILNLSEGGVLVESSDGMGVGTNVKIRLDSPELKKTPLDMTGVVVRDGNKEGKPELAIEFTRVNPSHKRLIQELVKSKTSKAA